MTPDDPLLHDHPATEAASGKGGPSAGGGAADARHVALASQPTVDDLDSEPDHMLDQDRSSDGRPDADLVPTATPTPAPGLTAPDDVARAHGLYGPEWSRGPQPAARYEGDELGAGFAGAAIGIRDAARDLAAAAAASHSGGVTVPSADRPDTSPAAGTPGGGLPAAGTPGGGLPAAGTLGGGLPAAGTPGGGLPAAGAPGGILPGAVQASVDAPDRSTAADDPATSGPVETGTPRENGANGANGANGTAGTAGRSAGPTSGEGAAMRSGAAGRGASMAALAAGAAPGSATRGSATRAASSGSRATSSGSRAAVAAAPPGRSVMAVGVVVGWVVFLLCGVVLGSMTRADHPSGPSLSPEAAAWRDAPAPNSPLVSAAAPDGRAGASGRSVTTTTTAADRSQRAPVTTAATTTTAPSGATTTTERDAGTTTTERNEATTTTSTTEPESSTTSSTEPETPTTAPPDTTTSSILDIFDATG